MHALSDVSSDSVVASTHLLWVSTGAPPLRAELSDASSSGVVAAVDKGFETIVQKINCFRYVLSVNLISTTKKTRGT